MEAGWDTPVAPLLLGYNPLDECINFLNMRGALVLSFGYVPIYGWGHFNTKFGILAKKLKNGSLGTKIIKTFLLRLAKKISSICSEPEKYSAQSKAWSLEFS